MSERRNNLSKKNRTKAYIAAGLVHVVIIGLMLFNFSTKREQVDAADADKIDVVKAKVVDDAQIEQEKEKIKKRERDKKRQREAEQRKLEKLKKEARKEEKRLKELKQKKADELEKQRKAILLKKQKEEKRKKDEAERKKKEEEAKKRKEDLERIEREKRTLESQRQLNESLANEEKFIAEQQAKQRTVTLVQRHFALIGKKIESVRTVDPSFEPWRKSVVDIKVSPSGVVQSVRTIESSGNARYDSSVENAVFKASPLPVPDAAQEPDANNQLREFEFEVKHPSARR